MSDKRREALTMTLRISAIAGMAAMAMAAADGSAAKALVRQMAALKDVKSLQADFICEKKLALLDSPLLSRGKLWIRTGDPRTGDGAVRFLTEKPYVSDLILVKGKVYARSQHETRWTRTDQSGRPGLTTVMAQLGGWSTGDAGKLADQFAVTTGDAAVPKTPGGVAAATQPAQSATDVFVLTPVHADLRKVVRNITVAIDRESHHLVYLEILTAQDDATRYWFYDVKDNPALAADAFSPEAEAAEPDAGEADAAGAGGARGPAKKAAATGDKP